MGAPTGHVISYPKEIDILIEASLETDDPETFAEYSKIKAEIMFNGNKLLSDLPRQFDDSVVVLKTADNQVLCVHQITCGICGSVVAASKVYTDRHLELHIKNGD